MSLDDEAFKEQVEEYIRLEVPGEVQRVVIVDEVQLHHGSDGVALAIMDYGPEDYWWVIGNVTPLCCYDYQDHPRLDAAKYRHYDNWLET